LNIPQKARRDKNLPDDARAPGGVHIDRNPGVMALWVCKHFRVKRADGGTLFSVGDPQDVVWYREGRPATRSEVIASIDSGLPTLTQYARNESLDAIIELGRYVAAIEHLLPAAV
jgi:hypothetical protein